MNYSIDLVSKGLPKIAFKSKTGEPVDTFLQDVLFGGAPIMGTEALDGIAFDFAKTAKHLPEEALRNTDPTRVNYRSNFNSEYVIPNYYHMEDKVELTDADTRVFGEDITTNVDAQDRVTKKFAEKRDGILQDLKVAKEKMCSDMIFNGQVVNKVGTQVMPVSSGLLALTGSNLFSAFEKCISDAYKNIRKVNSGFRATALVMNPDDALNLQISLKDLIHKETYDLGRAAFGAENKGAVACGTVNTPAGMLTIYAYYGTYDDGTNMYIPQGKAILCNGTIGSMAYGRVEAGEAGYAVQQERVTVYMKGDGDRKRPCVEIQSAPLPVITNVDGYGVLTSIPSSLS